MLVSNTMLMSMLVSEYAMLCWQSEEDTCSLLVLVLVVVLLNDPSVPQSVFKSQRRSLLDSAFTFKTLLMLSHTMLNGR